MFEPMSEAFADNPYQFYAKLRELDEPYFYEDINVYLLSKYPDVDGAARNPKLVRSQDLFLDQDDVKAHQRARNWHDMPNHERFVQSNLLERDGDSHFRLRVIAMRALTKSCVDKIRESLKTKVDALLNQLMQKSEVDFVADFASLIPAYTIGDLLGVPHEDRYLLRDWSNNIVQFYDVERTQAHKLLAENATTDFYLYLSDLVARKRKKPKEDLISSLVLARDAGEMSESELISMCMLILTAGHGSTIDALGSGMYALTSNPGQMSLLRREPSYIQRAVQEIFRYESPLPFFHRFASEALDLNGKTYPKGTKFGLLYGSANRDPEYWPSADTFSIARDQNRHIAFGRGAHLCLGNRLSGLTLEVALLEILKSTRHIEISHPKPTFKTGLSSRGLTSLGVALIPK